MDQERITPNEAASILGIGRSSIMRAIKAHKLLAMRDNNNNWTIEKAELERWAADRKSRSRPLTEQVAEKEVMDTPETLQKLAKAEARADAAERARDQAESDRDAWKEQAQKLADQVRPRGWWPWSR